jgi:hypothetical protein
MRTIWKYPLNESTSGTMLNLPQDAEFLSVQVQGNWACVWVLCDPEKPKTARGVRLYGTGQDVPNFPLPGPYIGTFQKGPFVFHAFEDLGCIKRQEP